MADAGKPVKWDDLEFDTVTEMVSRRVIIGGDQMLVQSYLKKGALVPRHRHAGDQWISVMQGALAVTVGSESVTVREGEVYRVPGRASHELEALEDSFVLDIRTGDVEFL